MGDNREDWGRVEWEFIVFNVAYNSLPDDLARAYLHLWITCAHLRRDVFSKRGIEEGEVAHRCRVRPDVMLRLIEAASPTDLLERGAHGCVRVCGVYKLHRKLRGWSHAPWPDASATASATDLGPNLSQMERERRGEESTPQTPHGGLEASPKQSRRQDYEALRTRIRTGQLRVAFRNNVLYAASVSPESKKIVLLAVGYPNADPVVLGRDDPWEAYEWKEKADG